MHQVTFSTACIRNSEVRWRCGARHIAHFVTLASHENIRSKQPVTACDSAEKRSERKRGPALDCYITKTRMTSPVLTLEY